MRRWDRNGAGGPKSIPGCPSANTRPPSSPPDCMLRAPWSSRGPPGKITSAPCSVSPTRPRPPSPLTSRSLTTSSQQSPWNVGRLRPTSITPRYLGSLTVPPGTPMGGQVLPVRAFLITHPQGVLLFDTGLGAEYETYDRLLTPMRRQLEDALTGSILRLTAVQAVMSCPLP